MEEEEDIDVFEEWRLLHPDEREYTYWEGVGDKAGDVWLIFMLSVLACLLIMASLQGPSTSTMERIRWLINQLLN